MNKKEKKILKYFEDSVDSSVDFSKIENKIKYEVKKKNTNNIFLKIYSVASALALSFVCIFSIVSYDKIHDKAIENKPTNNDESMQEEMSVVGENKESSTVIVSEQPQQTAEAVVSKEEITASIVEATAPNDVDTTKESFETNCQESTAIEAQPMEISFNNVIYKLIPIENENVEYESEIIGSVCGYEIYKLIDNIQYEYIAILKNQKYFMDDTL